jgi:hypothetical protein
MNPVRPSRSLISMLNGLPRFPTEWTQKRKTYGVHQVQNLVHRMSTVVTGTVHLAELFTNTVLVKLKQLNVLYYGTDFLTACCSAARHTDIA